jgi:hypothetical protein
VSEVAVMSQPMSRRTKVLVFLLRLMGFGGLSALSAVVMPTSWMVATHRWLGLGEMPTGPVVGIPGP